MSFSEIVRMIEEHGMSLTLIHLTNAWERAEDELKSKEDALQQARTEMESAKASVRHFVTQAAQKGLTKKNEDGHVLNVQATENTLISLFIGYDSDGSLEYSKTEIQTLPN